MSFMEKSSWVVVVVGVPILLVYAILVVPQVVGKPIAEVSWVGPMIFAIVAFVVANVLGNVAAAASDPRGSEMNDERDRAISTYAERVGNWLVIAGAIAGLVLAMAMAHQFWIANAIFLGGIAGSLLSSVTKIAAYHGPFQRW